LPVALQPSGEKRHQTAKTPLESGANYSAEAGENRNLCKSDFPPIEAARQVKILFSLMGELVPNF
jgi:hypothetical protein